MAGADICNYYISVSSYNIQAQPTESLTFGDYAKTVSHRSVEKVFEDGVLLVKRIINAQ